MHHAGAGMAVLLRSSSFRRLAALSIAGLLAAPGRYVAFARALDADLGEDRGQRGEDGGKQRPELPGGERDGGHDTILAVIPGVALRTIPE